MIAVNFPVLWLGLGWQAPHLRLKIYFYIYRRSGEDPDVAIWVHSNRGLRAALTESAIVG